MKQCTNCNEVGFTKYIPDPKLNFVPNVPEVIYRCNNDACGIALEQEEYDELPSAK